MNKQTKTFIKNIVKRASGHSGVIVIASYGQDLSTGREIEKKIKQFPIQDSAADEILDYIGQIEQDQNRNIYICDSIMRKGLDPQSRGKKSDIVAGLFVGVDWDLDKLKESFDPKYPTEIPEPSYVIQSSPKNMQLIYVFEEVDDQVDRYESIQEKLCDIVDADKGARGIGRLWRIPGLLNWPNKKKVQEGRAEAPFETSLKDGLVH
jgi:hypothetical protein